MKEKDYGWRVRPEDDSIVIKEFRRTVEGMDVDLNQMNGSVLVVGCSAAFPERLFFCDDGDFHLKLRPEVDKVVCMDSSTIVGLIIDEEVQYGFPDDPENDVRVTYHPTSLQAFVKRNPGVYGGEFDVATMFRIPSFSKQFEVVLKSLDGLVKPGGKFFGSGAFPSREWLAENAGDNWTVKDVYELSNPDSTGYPYVGSHVGFCLEKRDLN